MNQSTGSICGINSIEAGKFVLQMEFLSVILTLEETSGGRGERKGLAVYKRKFVNYFVLSVEDIELCLHYSFPLVPDSWPFRTRIRAERKDS